MGGTLISRSPPPYSLAISLALSSLLRNDVAVREFRNHGEAFLHDPEVVSSSCRRGQCVSLGLSLHNRKKTGGSILRRPQSRENAKLNERLMEQRHWVPNTSAAPLGAMITSIINRENLLCTESCFTAASAPQGSWIQGLKRTPSSGRQRPRTTAWLPNALNFSSSTSFLLSN